MDNNGRVCTLDLLPLVLLTRSLSYEFATNEYINAMAIVTLETSSTDNGSKDFIAVGTTINRGEDLAAKGAVGVPASTWIPRSDMIEPDLYL